MLDLDEVREHLRIDDVDTSDTLLSWYINAAVRRFEHKTGRRLFSEQGMVPNPEPENALILDDDVVLALLLLVGHWNANREATSDLQVAPIPLGFDDLANPYRWWPD